MGYSLNCPVAASELAGVLGLEMIGPDVEIEAVATLSGAGPGVLVFSKEIVPTTGVAICRSGEVSSSSTVLRSEAPRLDFIRALEYLDGHVGFPTYDFDSDVHSTVQCGRNVVIERGCTIGEGVVLEHNVVIQAGTVIAPNTRIRTGTCVGGDGFGFERDPKSGRLIRFVHLGGVEIGRNVEIGALNSIVRGALGNTCIGDNVKTDNLVHIAHNCQVGPGVLITACAELSGGVEVGEDAWIGPNSSIMQKARIGARSLVGLGAVVLKETATGSVYAGNPARLLRKDGEAP